MPTINNYAQKEKRHFSLNSCQFVCFLKPRLYSFKKCFFSKLNVWLLDNEPYRLMIYLWNLYFWFGVFSRNSGDDVGLGTVHRPVLMALEEEVTEDGMASTSSLTSSVQSPLKAIASAVFSSSAPSSSSTQHVYGSSTMTTTPKPVKKDIYRGDCQVDDAGRGGQSAAETVWMNEIAKTNIVF